MSPGQQPITSIHRDDIITASSSDCRRVTGALKCQEEGGGEGGGSSSREQGSSNRTWSRSSTGSGSQAAPAAPPAGEAEPEEHSE